MNKMVEDYLNKKAKESAELEQQNKNALLIELGLYEKEYSNEDGYSAEYPETEWNESGIIRHYRKIPIAVSDDEFSEILKYQEETEPEIQTNNTVSIIFKILAWIIFIGGFIAGIFLGQNKVSNYYSSGPDFSFDKAFIYWAVSFVSGMLLLGFAEIIQLLHDIKNLN